MDRLVGVLVVAVLLTGCFKQAPDETASGEELFNYYCAGCHKESGQGKFLKGIPANRLTRLNRAQVIELVRFGMETKPAMPPIKSLSYLQAKSITNHLWMLRDAEIKRLRANQ